MSGTPAMDEIEILPWHGSLWERVNEARRAGRLSTADETALKKRL